MNRLLKFYLPKVFPEIFKYFIVTILVSGMIQFLPVGDKLRNGFTSIFIAFVFPVIAYFNKAVYLPSSLNWIFLTPVKKMHIVSAHGLINLIKATFILLLINVFYLFYERGDLSKLPFVEFWETLSSDEGGFSSPVRDLLGNAAFLISLVVLFMGIMPSFLQIINQKYGYHVSRSFSHKIKFYLYLLLGFIIGAALIGSQNSSQYFIPGAIKGSLLFSLLVFGSIFSTLKSLKLYFNEKVFIIVSFVFFVLLATSIYMRGSNDIFSKEIKISDKMRTLDFMGVYSEEEAQQVENELLDFGSDVALLPYHKLKDFFELQNRKLMFQRVVEKWEILCKERKDVTCRLAWYMHSIPKDNKSSIDEIRHTCPTDLGSCYALYNSKKIPKDEQDKARDLLQERCGQNIIPKIDKVTCKRFKYDNEKKNEH